MGPKHMEKLRRGSRVVVVAAVVVAAVVVVVAFGVGVVGVGGAAAVAVFSWAPEGGPKKR